MKHKKSIKPVRIMLAGIMSAVTLLNSVAGAFATQAEIIEMTEEIIQETEAVENTENTENTMETEDVTQTISEVVTGNELVDQSDIGFGSMREDYDPELLKSDPYAIMPLAADGKRYFDEFFDLPAGALYGNLKYHENDGFYTGTRYVGVTSSGPLLSSNTPKGDTANYALGYGLNCCGFVMRTIFEAAASPGGLNNYREWFKSKGIAAGLSNDYNPADMGVLFDEFFYAPNKDKYVHYEYPSREACVEGINQLIDQGLISSGAIIATMPTDAFYTGSVRNKDSYGNYIDCHIGFYWNEAGTHIDTNSKVYWNATHPTTGLGSTVVDSITQVSNVGAKCAGCIYYVFPLAPVSTKGSAQLVKKSAKPEMTQNNGAYSLAGAVYGVYTDSACTSKVADLTTDANGNSNIIEVDEATYYVKEITAPKGYALDTKVYTAVVRRDEKTTVEVSDIPQNNPVDIMVRKYDSDKSYSSSGNEPQGAASLADAEFTVKFYAGYYDTMQSLNGVSPARTWVLKTDSKGLAYLSKDYLVSGDSFYMDSTGKIALPLGTVTIQETKAPNGYRINGEVFVRQITSAGTAETVSTFNVPAVPDIVIRGGVKIQKRDFETKETKPQGGATLENTTFVITNLSSKPVIVGGKSYANGQVVMTIKTDKNCIASTSGDALPFGHYKIEESAAPDGYLSKGAEAKIFDIVENGKIIDLTDEDSSVSNQVIRGGVKIQKRDLETSGTQPQGSAVLEDAVFSIVSLNDNPVVVNGTSYSKDQVVMTIQTNKSGIATTAGNVLPYGHYRIEETTAPAGYLKDGAKPKEFNITTDGEIVDLTSKEQSIADQVIRGGVKIQKRDMETSGTEPQGNATLQGAVFTITSLNDHPVMVNGEMYEKNTVVMSITTNETGIASTANNALPYGHYIIEETAAPAGYLSDGAEVREFSITENGVIVDLTDESASIANQIIRGGVKIQKRDIETCEDKPQGDASLADAVFAITNLSDHSVMVDGKMYESGQVVIVLTTDEDGIAQTVKDSLPYGHYKIEETAAPEGYLNKGKISVEFDVLNDGEIVDLTDVEHSILNQVIRGDLEFVKISEGDHQRLSNVPFTITSKTTGESHTIITDINGYASTSAEWNKHSHNTNQGQTPEDGIWFGMSEVDDTKGALIYDTYVVEEQRCASNEGLNLLKFEVTIYKDSVTVKLGTLTDTYIDIGTAAHDEWTNSHMSSASETVTIVDKVTYSGLRKGEKYRMAGTLMDADSGEAILVNNAPVTAETEFTARMTSGNVEVTFVHDASLLAGKTTVIFEDLYQEDTKVASHADLENTDQTIYFPEIGTTLKDSETDSNIAQAVSEVILVDTVSYKNLIPGKTYVVTGTLMDKETGKVIEIDGKPVTAEASFIPAQTVGSVEVSFNFDGSMLKGKTVVAFESLSYDGKELAVHADIEDEAQTVYFPEISTEAKDGADDDKEIEAGKEVTIVDTVTYKNLIVGAWYKVTGILMDKETGKSIEVSDAPVTAEAVFKAETSDGTVDVIFTFDASALGGQTIVVFEKMYILNDEAESQIAAHEDLNDDGQTVTVTKALENIPETVPETEITENITPKTGDSTPVLLFACIAAFSALAVVGVSFYKRKLEK